MFVRRHASPSWVVIFMPQAAICRISSDRRKVAYQNLSPCCRCTHVRQKSCCVRPSEAPAVPCSSCNKFTHVQARCLQCLCFPCSNSQMPCNRILGQHRLYVYKENSHDSPQQTFVRVQPEKCSHHCNKFFHAVQRKISVSETRLCAMQ